MPKVINPGLAGRVIGAAGARVEFDADGVAVVTAEQAELLGQIEGNTVIADAAPKKAPEAPKVVEAPKAEPVVAEVAAEKKVAKKSGVKNADKE